MKAKITILRGRQVMFSGIVTADPEAYPDHDFRRLENFLGDVFNIERHINNQGAYRCHVEEVDTARPAREHQEAKS